MAENLQEDQRRRNGKRSRSIEETKRRNLDLRLSKPGWRSDERHEIDSRSRAEKKDKEGQILDYRDSSNTYTRENQKQQRLRDVEMQRRRYETESRIWREEMDRSPDLRRRYDETASDWGESKSEWRYDKRTGRRYERLQSGGYIVHPGKNDCFSYFQTGTCLNGRSSCKFNHPTTLPHELPKKTSNVPICKHFLRGYCKKGSECDFPHAIDRDGAEPMPQARSMDRRASESEWEFDERIERRYETDSGYRPEKRTRTIPDSRPRDPRGTFEDIRQRRPEIEQERREIPENRFMAVQRARERREAQDNMQEQRSGGRIIDLSHLINPIAEEILRERMMIPVNPRVNAQVNLQQQRLVREMPENHNVEAHNQQNPQEQRKIEIERQRSEARLRLDQMQPTALFDESSRARELMKELGFKDAKGI